jgi:hypothetical protein
MIPGQFDLSAALSGSQVIERFNHIESGMPSVMQTAGKAGVGSLHDCIGGECWGNIYHGCVGAGLFTASSTVSKIGTPSCSVPPFPGVTPATTLVP